MEDLNLGIQWKRPTSVPFPNIWYKFEIKLKDGKTHKIRIEDLTPERYEEVVDFMMKYYFTGEPLSVSSKLLEDDISTMVYQIFLSKILENNVSIIAVLDDDSVKPEIIGLQILSVQSKNDPLLPEVPGEAIGKMIKIYHDIRKDVDPFEVFESDTILHDWGLCVKPEYRGAKVGYNILLSLEKIAKEFGIRGSMIMFTRTESQVIAERAKFKLYNEIVYSEYKDENGEIVFPVEGTKSLKYMGIKFL